MKFPKYFPSGSNVRVFTSTSFILIISDFVPFPRVIFMDLSLISPIVLLITEEKLFIWIGSELEFGGGNICCVFHRHINFRTVNGVFELYIFKPKVFDLRMLVLERFSFFNHFFLLFFLYFLFLLSSLPFFPSISFWKSGEE